MNVLIRVDASTRIGLGHSVRCRTLGAALRERGAAVRFVCRAHPGHQVEALAADGFPVSILPEPAGRASLSGSYASWLGVPQQQDAAETVSALRDDGPAPDWLIVDHYALDATWESALRPWAGQIMVIDDLANRQHECDLLLDQNYVRDPESRYAGRVPAQARILSGPAYALLRPEFAASRPAAAARGAAVRRVFVFLGGTDPDNVTGRVLEAFSHASLSHLELDVVVGANNPHRPALLVQADARPGIHVHLPRPHLADLMAACDLAIGAGGTTTWERACLGLPSVVVSIAENQRGACEALAEDGLIAYAGDQAQVSGETIREAVARLLDDAGRLARMRAASFRLVDGRGVQRVLEALGVEGGDDAAP